MLRSVEFVRHKAILSSSLDRPLFNIGYNSPIVFRARTLRAVTGIATPVSFKLLAILERI